MTGNIIPPNGSGGNPTLLFYKEVAISTATAITETQKIAYIALSASERNQLNSCNHFRLILKDWANSAGNVPIVFDTNDIIKNMVSDIYQIRGKYPIADYFVYFYQRGTDGDSCNVILDNDVQTRYASHIVGFYFYKLS